MPVMPSTLRPVSNPTYSSPSTKVPAFTASAGIDYAVRALEAGVSGYVLKGSTATNFPTLESVLTGEAFITPISPHCVTRPYESLPIAQSNVSDGAVPEVCRSLGSGRWIANKFAMLFAKLLSAALRPEIPGQQLVEA